MVHVMERLIQRVKPGKWAALDEIDKKFDAIESKLGFPPKKRYRSLAGPLDNDTIIIEREWKSMAIMEQTILATAGNAELQEMGMRLNDIIDASWHELYAIWPYKV